jgi:integrase
VLSPKELKLIWQYDHPPFSDILKLCILTGQRRSEIAATTSDWIDGDVLHIPAHITKNKRPHSLPITGRSKQYLPVGGFNGWSKAKVRIDKHIPLQHWTIHDLRRTFSTIHAEIGTPLHVTEKLLNHVSGTVSGVAAIYNRHTYMIEMRDALEAYDAHIATILVI